jgi:hypothetical protein
MCWGSGCWAFATKQSVTISSKSSLIMGNRKRSASITAGLSLESGGGLAASRYAARPAATHYALGSLLQSSPTS